MEDRASTGGTGTGRYIRKSLISNWKFAKVATKMLLGKSHTEDFIRGKLGPF